MMQHKRVTVDFSNYNKGTYDLALPILLPMRTLIPLIMDSLDIELTRIPKYVKITTKHHLLVENDRLIDFQIADGDILKMI
ncbi:EsaB/YukD family protein [Staphylococcus hyicus]|uniref:EsaB/YukD family protein n=1 Tax=Staphylococcus hyicus TaxID=1284 RepID=UPI00057F541C|nr:EsaB/YukD family protein [Staphylococcus hyicus]AJC97012.1 type VII secretion protein EsaB [Staphylococcus hyicus]MCE5154086.1 type VII secretion protein EsaB [Staphylococcus hyicus]MCQ9291749.1 type VII secretion protein EsaB [Staphylococcus hyicus]MCQ9306990.1 type VII secretion protein EsaB [Staphylococcus hyicus]MCQ9309476.1 type VII secretion protein EsaB [Staphylococcus hyicus]